MGNKKFENYSFYKGENECPFDDEGRSFWWRIESEAYLHEDNKIQGELSPIMWEYLRNKMWQGDAHSDTTEEEFVSRTKEMYDQGVWSRSYITVKDYPINKVFRN